MKTVRYPKDDRERQLLKERYVKALGQVKDRKGNSKLKVNQEKWAEMRNRLKLTSMPESIEDILKAEYPILIRYYKDYAAIKISKKNKLKLEKIFSYSDFHDAIASFFMNDQNGFDLRVCHYCGMTYINKYTIDSDQKGLEQLNEIDDIEKLSKLLGISNRKNLQKVLANKPYTFVEDFNHVVKWRSKDKFHSIFPCRIDKNHFDLDHVLDKGSCPITAISLMNFVPSCSVCNEKLKRSKVLGRGNTPIEELSPTDIKFDFDNQVEFVLMLKPEKEIENGLPTEHADDYDLEMKVRKKEYERYIKLFHLKERYQFHKMEALFWLEQKYRYTDSRIALMAEGLKDSAYSEQRIKADIFQELLDKRERCFEKLKKDILK